MRSSPGAAGAGTAPGARAADSYEIERLVALAHAGLDASRPREAKALARQAVGILGVDHEGEGGSRARVGVAALGALRAALRVQGRYGEAETALRASLALAERAQDGELLIVQATNDLAVLYKYTARFDEAEALYRRALQIGETRRGPDHVEVATLWHNIAGLDHSRGNHARAEPAARRALEIRTRALGAAHPDVAADSAALGAILDALGRLDEAEGLLRDALATFTALRGACHHEVAINTNNLAAVQYRRGRTDDAEALWRQGVVCQARAPRSRPSGVGYDGGEPRRRGGGTRPRARSPSALRASCSTCSEKTSQPITPCTGRPGRASPSSLKARHDLAFRRERQGAGFRCFHRCGRACSG